MAKRVAQTGSRSASGLGVGRGFLDGKKGSPNQVQILVQIHPGKHVGGGLP
jgi:hypothetical protein